MKQQDITATCKNGHPVAMGTRTISACPVCKSKVVAARANKMEVRRHASR